MIPRLLFVVLFAIGCDVSRPPIFDCTKENCEDCAVLEAKLSWDAQTRRQCDGCQGATEADAGSDCFNVPQQNGRFVMRGCNTDNDCRGLSSLCGRFTGHPHNTCVESDAK